MSCLLFSHTPTQPRNALRFHNIATSDIISCVGQLNEIIPSKKTLKLCILLVAQHHVEHIKRVYNIIMLNTLNEYTI